MVEPTVLAGGVAVVTGAGSGIGAALARRAAEYGMRVALADVQTSAIDLLSEELDRAGAETFALTVDVRSYQAVTDLAEQVYERWGTTTMLFNNAAIMVLGNTWETDVEDWTRAVDIGLTGAFHGVRAFVPRMIAQDAPAHVVNVASVGAFRISPHRSSYCAAKHGCLAFTESVARELEEVTDQVRVSAVVPGPVRTGIHKAAISSDTDGPGARSSTEFTERLENHGMESMAAAEIIIARARCGDLRIHTDRDLSRSFIEARHLELLDGLG